MKTEAIDYFERTGTILPSHAAEVAQYLSENNAEN
jgi:hypothetical protein